MVPEQAEPLLLQKKLRKFREWGAVKCGLAVSYTCRDVYTFLTSHKMFQ